MSKSFVFSPKRPDETIRLSFDWGKLLSTNEDINSVTVTSDAGSISSEAASGPIVSFLLAGGESGDVISVTCEIQTTAGQILEDTETCRVI
jgi:hypothetical protein